MGRSIAIRYEAGNFERFYRVYRTLVYSTAIRIVRNATDAEDVTQTVFMKVWQRPPAFRGGNVESWLITVSRNSAIDVLRKNRGGPLEIPDKMLRSWAADDDVAGDAVTRLLMCHVRNGFHVLRRDQRALLVGSFLDERSHAHLAEATALPLGTVKTRIRSAIRRLRNELGPDEPGARFPSAVSAL